jgi:hypothetical protein
MIKEQLKPLFRVTKELKGNADLKDNDCKASYKQLEELFLVFEYILNHFKKLKQRLKAQEFKNYISIQKSITLAWNKAKKYYGKTDTLVA